MPLTRNESRIPDQKALDKIDISTIVLDPQGAIITLNKACRETIGLSLEKTRGRAVWDVLLAPDNADPIQRAFNKKNHPSDFIHSWTSTHGENGKIIWANQVVFNDSGAVQHIISMGMPATTDSSPQKQSPNLGNGPDDWHKICDTISEAVTIHDDDYNILFANQAAKNMLGLGAREKPSKKCYEYYHGTNFAPAGCASCRTLQTGEPSIVEIFEPKLNKHIEIKALPRFDRNNQIIGVIHIVSDIDARMKAEEAERKIQTQLFQSQKMECVGQLASGVAHDFNNILTSIIGYCELSIIETPEGHPLRDNLEIIYGSAQKAVNLTRQLLSFSRKQLLNMKVLDLNQTVEEMLNMLRRLIGEDVNLIFKAGKTVNKVEADPGQLEQILMNLAINARDAMVNGGSLTIETMDAKVKTGQIPDQENIQPGAYVMLAVTDTGAGMSSEVKEKIFEPFFTTKEPGKGTGLGLATVYGIVKQHHGFIRADSKVGKGTTFRIYLPASNDEYSMKDKGHDLSPAPHGTETILVAEDDSSIRRLIVEVLSHLGYHVLDAENGQKALEISAYYKGKIQLLLTDVIMPKVSGKKLTDTIVSERPDIKIIYMSGYPDDVIKKHGVLKPGAVFMQKPIPPLELATQIRQTLDQEPQPRK